MNAIPYAPTQLSREQVDIACALARRRQPFRFGAWYAEIVAPPAASDTDVEMALTIGGHCATAFLPRTLYDAILSGLDQAAPCATQDVAPLLMELALERLLNGIETAAAGLEIAILPRESTTAVAGQVLGLACQVAGSAGTIRLHLAPWADQAVARALSAAPVRREQMPDLPVILHVRVLAASLPVAALRALRQGDVVLADWAGADEVLLVAGERLIWRGRRQGQAVLVTSARLAARHTGFGDWMMEEPASSLEDIGQDAADIGELPVRLAFELGRLEIKLAELETLGPGHVFQLGGDEAQPVDIVANGRRIGRGRIVTVGGEIGVQVVWIGRHA